MQLTHPDTIAAITKKWRGKRDANNRPMVSDRLLKRMQSVTIEEAWHVLTEHDYHHNFAGDWTVLFPDQVLVGRAVTCRWVPIRPELHQVIVEQGERETESASPTHGSLTRWLTATCW